jgi:DNA-binding transcriptional LysR family regulator
MQNMQLSKDRRDLDDIEAFVAIAEEGSFTRAARRLGRDATILSRRLKALETRLGVRLIERTTRTASLTESGQIYLERLRPALRALDEADREASSYSEGYPRGHLRLALPGGFGRLWVTPLLSEFLAAYPGVTIEAQYSEDFVDLVGERFDLAIRLGILGDSRLIARKIGVRRRLLCASPEYLEKHGVPKTAEDLKHHACLRYGSGPHSSVWEMTGPSGRLERVRVSGPLTVDDTYTLVAAAMAGTGIMLSVDWVIGYAAAAGKLVPILTDHTIADEGGIYIVMPSAPGMPTKTRAFADWVAERLGRNSPWLVGTTARAWSPGVTAMGLGKGVVKPEPDPKA